MTWSRPEGWPVTSSRIRALVAAGDVGAAANFWAGRRASQGVCIVDAVRAPSIGFPTANVVPVEFAAIPADGVYAGRAILADEGVAGGRVGGNATDISGGPRLP